MSQIEKLIQRLKTRPKDFTYDELRHLLLHFGLKEDVKGKSSGSRVRFIYAKDKVIELHKPHPKNVIKEYKLKEIMNILYKWGLI